MVDIDGTPSAMATNGVAEAAADARGNAADNEAEEEEKEEEEEEEEEEDDDDDDNDNDDDDNDVIPTGASAPNPSANSARVI